jgi:hypothetical protein
LSGKVPLIIIWGLHPEKKQEYNGGCKNISDKKGQTDMKKIRKIIHVLLLAVAVSASAVTVTAGSLTALASTESREEFLISLIPEEGFCYDGRSYSRDDIASFLDEIEANPDGYAHKDHHCILQGMDNDRIQKLVTILRLLLGC